MRGWPAINAALVCGSQEDMVVMARSMMEEYVVMYED